MDTTQTNILYHAYYLPSVGTFEGMTPFGKYEGTKVPRRYLTVQYGY